MARKSKDPNENWTLKDIKDWIRNAYNDVIIPKIDNYLKDRKNLGFDTKFENLVGKLQKSATGKVTAGFKMIMNLGKNKKALLDQVKKAKSLMKYDYKDKAIKKFGNEKTERAYKSFTESHDPTMSREEYLKLIDVFNSLGSFLNEFGYEDYGQLTETKEYSGTRSTARAGNESLVGNLVDYTKDKYSVDEIVNAMKATVAENYGTSATIIDNLTTLKEKLENNTKAENALEAEEAEGIVAVMDHVDDIFD